MNNNIELEYKSTKVKKSREIFTAWLLLGLSTGIGIGLICGIIIGINWF